MAAAEYDITIDTGASFILDVAELKNPDGTAFDTTGYKGRFKLKSEKSEYSASFSADDSGSLISTVASGVHIELLPSQTAQIPIDDEGEVRTDTARHIYEIELYNPLRVIRLLRGKAYVVRGIGL